MSGTVCLTFDFDAVSLWISRGMAQPGPLARGEFGVEAVPRLLELLRARSLPATWFIPGHTVESFPAPCEAIVAAGHEVGLHGYLHENVELLDAAAERRMLERSCAILERLTGTRPLGNRTPSWSHSASTVELLLAHGVRYDSSLFATDHRPYRMRTGDVVAPDGPFQFGNETELIQVPVSWSLDDYPAFEFVRTNGWVIQGLKRPSEVFANWLDDVTYMQRDIEDGVCVVTFHPQVIGRGHRLLALERFVDTLVARGLRFATVGQISQEFSDGRDFGRWRPVSAQRRPGERPDAA